MQQAKDELLEALQRSKNELKQSFVQQRTENQRLHELIRALRNENFALQQKQLALQRRLQAVEVELGQWHHTEYVFRNEYNSFATFLRGNASHAKQVINAREEWFIFLATSHKWRRSVSPHIYGDIRLLTSTRTTTLYKLLEEYYRCKFPQGLPEKGTTYCRWPTGTAHHRKRYHSAMFLRQHPAIYTALAADEMLLRISISFSQGLDSKISVPHIRQLWSFSFLTTLSFKGPQQHSMRLIQDIKMIPQRVCALSLLPVSLKQGQYGT